MRPRPDLTIVGFGLAGATLAWALHDAGLKLRIIDRPMPGAASRVAAGLITPVTGKKLKPEPQFVALRRRAQAHYLDVAERTDETLLYERPALRVLCNDAERRAWAHRSDELEALAHESTGDQWRGVAHNRTCLLMPQAARLDTETYLDVSRDWLGRFHEFHRHEPTEPRTPVVWCCGHQERTSIRVTALDWRPAKGEILVIQSSQISLPGTLHSEGLWITPIRDDTFLAGATYSWDSLDGESTEHARAQILESLARIVEVPFEVVGQRAGVRPIVAGRKPVIGALPDANNAWLYNGLGSKGSLYAPTMAHLLSRRITKGAEIPAAYELAQRLSRQ